MENKFIAIVYDVDMNDILKNANVLGTFSGMKVDAGGRYHEMSFYELGFDYKTWKELKLAKVNIDYLDDMNNLYSLRAGKCNNRNLVIKMKDMINNELANAKVIKEQIAIRDGLLSNGDKGIVEYKSKKTSVVPNKKAMSLVAYDKDSELVMPFREIINGTSSNLPLFIYLHDERSRGTNNTTVLLKECKNLIAALKASGEEFIMVVPNVATKYELRTPVDGYEKIVQSSLNRLLHDVITYEVKEHDADPKRIYIMGTGSGAADVLNEVELSSSIYAAAVVAFGIGEYDYIEKFKNVHYEVASASDDPVYDDKDISNFVEDLKDTEIDVNYTELEGALDKALKVFYTKDTAWLNNVFASTKKDVPREKLVKEVKADENADEKKEETPAD